MNVILRVLQNCLIGCSHPNTIRERRKLYGVDVLHLVCEDCGHAVPAIQRTPGEHARMVRVGAVRRPRSHRVPTKVVDMGQRLRAS